MFLYDVLFQTPKFSTLRNIYFSHVDLNKNFVVYVDNYFPFLNSYFFVKNFFRYYYIPKLDFSVVNSISFVNNEINAWYFDLIVPPVYFLDLGFNDSWSFVDFTHDVRNLFLRIISDYSERAVNVMNNVFFKKYFLKDEFINFYNYYVLNYFGYFYFKTNKNMLLYENLKRYVYDAIFEKVGSLNSLTDEIVQIVKNFAEFTNEFKTFLNDFKMQQSDYIGYVVHLLSDLYFLINNFIFVDLDFSESIFEYSYKNEILSDAKLITNNVKKYFKDKMYYVILPLNIYSYVRENNFDKVFYESYFYMNDIFLSGFYGSRNVNVSARDISVDTTINRLSSVVYHITISALLEFFANTSNVEDFYKNLEVGTSRKYFDYVKSSLSDLTRQIADVYLQTFGDNDNIISVRLTHVPIFSIDDIAAALVLWILFENMKN